MRKPVTTCHPVMRARLKARVALHRDFARWRINQRRGKKLASPPAEPLSARAPLLQHLKDGEGDAGDSRHGNRRENRHDPNFVF
jgi:hypothetical protein